MVARRAGREVGVRRVVAGADQAPGADRDLALGDRVVDVVGRLDRRVVVERHPAFGAGRLGRDHRALAADGGVAEPALGAGGRRAHARAAGVVDGDREVGAARDRRGRRDHELRRRARRVDAGAGDRLRRAGRRVRIGRADRGHQARAMRERVGIVLAGWVAGVRRLDELERCRLAVDGDRPDREVRAGRRAGDPVVDVEVEAEVAQALRRALLQVDVRARQEQVRHRVVVDEHVAVDARVAAVADLGVHAVAGRGERVRAGRAGLGGRGPGAGAHGGQLHCGAAHRRPAADEHVGLRRRAAEVPGAGAGRRARGQVVGAAAEAGRELDRDAVARGGVRGHRDRRAPHELRGDAGALDPHRDVGGDGVPAAVDDHALQRARVRARLERAQRPHRDPGRRQRRTRDQPRERD